MDPPCARFTAAEGGARLASAARSSNTLVVHHAAFVAMTVLHEEGYKIRGRFSDGRQRSVYITRESQVACVAYELSILTDLSVTSAAAAPAPCRDEIETKEVLVCTSAVARNILEENVLTMADINVLIIDSCHLIYKDKDLQYIMKIFKQQDENYRPRILALTYPLFSSPKQPADPDPNETKDNINVEEKTKEVVPKEIGAYENLDDFKMYEKIEWKIDMLEDALCCKADLAEDIDVGKRFSVMPVKPKEYIIEYKAKEDESKLSESYLELDEFMRDTVHETLNFLNEHRYDPTEIYGEDMYEELKSIPDPTIEPKLMLKQFIYVLDQLGPYGADKAAFCLLTKLEKLKIKVPYERHFLLLCLCTTVFVKIRSYADSIFSQYESDWQKIQSYCTSKVLRFAEVLEKFKPSDLNNQEMDKKDDIEKKLDAKKLLNDIDNCDFAALGNKIEDKVNIYASNLKDLDITDTNSSENSKICDKVNSSESISTNSDNLSNEIDKTAVSSENTNNLESTPSTGKLTNNVHTQNGVDTETTDLKTVNPLTKGALGFRKTRARGRGRVQRSNTSRLQQMLQNPDALCGVVFVREPLMAKILFMLVVEMTRHRPPLSYLSAQYCAIEQRSGTGRDNEVQRRRQEEVLKKFRMHECNLLLANSALEEGIDLPRCNLVLRWDMPDSYRSCALSFGRARAPRSACVTLTARAACRTLLQHRATYYHLDQIISKKCGCGVQDEPTQAEEDDADKYTCIVQPYVPPQNHTKKTTIHPDELHTKDIDMNVDKCHKCNKNNTSSDKLISDKCDSKNKCKNKCEMCEVNELSEDLSNVKLDCAKTDVEVASVDLNSAIALINRYCGKLPSDTFTRLTPQWWLEELELPMRGKSGEMGKAFICTLRLPLNCPVKYNIVGHPMPTRVLARRMVALQACRILHKSGELDNQLMPIGKDNFKATELDLADVQSDSTNDPSDLARPGTTKRRQYYYKRTARAFTDCEPIIDATDEEIAANPEYVPKPVPSGSRRNMAYLIACSLVCALPERYNTRGRRLHAPQRANHALAILAARRNNNDLQIPAFPVYTRSGEVRVALQPAPLADVRLSPRRARLVRRFMRFVFEEVLRVRRRGMTLQSNASNQNNYYIVPTVKATAEDGSTKIDIDWAFLELIYQHTEDKKSSALENPLLWYQDEEENQDMVNKDIDMHKNKETDVKTKDIVHVDGKIENQDMVNEDVDMHKNKETEIETKDIVNVDDNIACDNDLNHVDSNNKVKETISKVNSIKKDDAKAETKDESNCENNTVKSPNGEDISNDIDKMNSYNKTKGKFDKSKTKVVKKMANPLLKEGEIFVFDPEKYREAVVTPWYRNQDQPQFFLVAEICNNLTPDSAFPSATHTTFRDYYSTKYGVELTQSHQPLLDVDHTSARLNLLTPRYVNRKGVALPVSSERTRRAKRDRLDQKQILVPELCRVHPFAAPLWFATVALPCVLYRINALLIADEIRALVAREIGVGIPEVNDQTCPGFRWPPLHFGWTLHEVLNADEKSDKKNQEDAPGNGELNEQTAEGIEEVKEVQKAAEDVEKDKTINDILQEKEDAESGFEIGTWSNEMASSIPQTPEYDEYMEPLPSNLTFCTSASGGTNWCDPAEKRKGFNPSRPYSVADSDCSYMSSDFDTDDSDMNSETSDDDGGTSGFCSSRNSDAAMGVRIEYKTPHEAEAVDVERKTKTSLAPQPDERDDALDRREMEEYMKSGDAPTEYIEIFHSSVENHKKEILEKGLLMHHDQPISDLLPESANNSEKPTLTYPAEINQTFNQMFPFGTEESSLLENGKISLDNVEKSKRKLLAEFKKSKTKEELKKLNCFSMVDVDIDSPDYVNEKLVNIGFSKEDFVPVYNELPGGNFSQSDSKEFVPYYEEVKGEKKDFDFDYQPDLRGHPGPSPSLILQALTMSNANDGINLERLETIGDSFLKFAITAYLYCAHPTVHEGKLSHMRSKQVSNLHLYRLGRARSLGARMTASKFEPHDNWLPPCHAPPPPPQENAKQSESMAGDGCFIPYNLITQHSIPDKSIADCVEALIGAYLLSLGARGALLFMSWLGLRVLPRHTCPVEPQIRPQTTSERTPSQSNSDSQPADGRERPEWCDRRIIGSFAPTQDEDGDWVQVVFGELKAPPSPLLRYIEDPEGELEQMLSGYDALERTLQYRFKDRSLLLQALTHASHQANRLTDCYQRLEFLGDAILDYLITRHLYADARRHSPGALTDLRSALVNNTIFATLAVRHGFHKYFRHMSPGLNEVLTKYVKIQEENGHSISEEHYLIQEDELEQAEDVEVPKALGDLFESVAGAIFLDSGMSLGAVWKSYVRLMGAELEAFSAAAPKSPVRELLEAEPDTAKFGKPERLADGRRVRVCVEVFGRGAFKGIGRNYRIAKGTAARCALRHLKRHRPYN